MFESVNFKEFVKLLSAFSERASNDDRLNLMFSVYDVDGDGECMHGRMTPMYVGTPLPCRKMAPPRQHA